jgi:MoxR-like ATPase
MFDSIRDFSERLRRTGYFIDPVMTQVVFLAIKLHKPLLLEGPAGSGKMRISSSLISRERRNPLLLIRHFLPTQRSMLKRSSGTLHPRCAKR